jgi:hypothetical protein
MDSDGEFGLFLRGLEARGWDTSSRVLMAAEVGHDRHRPPRLKFLESNGILLRGEQWAWQILPNTSSVSLGKRPVSLGASCDVANNRAWQLLPAMSSSAFCRLFS